MKVTVIRGGSSYTPELINGFVERVPCFPLSELWLMDVARERLEIVGGFARRMLAAQGAPFAVHLTTDQRQALAGASEEDLAAYVEEVLVNLVKVGATKPVVLEKPRRCLQSEVTPDEYYEDPARHMKRLYEEFVSDRRVCHCEGG